MMFMSNLPIGISFSKCELHSFLVESLRMDRFSHLHVLGMLGVCLDAGPAPYIVLPFMSGGSLLCYLRNRRSELVLSRFTTDKTVRWGTTYILKNIYCWFLKIVCMLLWHELMHKRTETDAHNGIEMNGHYFLDLLAKIWF